MVRDNTVSQMAVLALCGAAMFGLAMGCRGTDLPRVESNGRVVVLDDFENGLGAWEGDAEAELGPGATKASKALVWHCTDVNTELHYKFASRIPDLPNYARITLDLRAWDDEGRKGPGVATYDYLVYGGLPWQLPHIPPTWALWDRRPVSGDQWRSVSYDTHYPEWYNFGVRWDNTLPNLSLGSSAMFAMNATLMLDNIRLIADPIAVLGREEGGVWGEGRWLANGDFRYDYRIHLRNLTGEVQTVRAKAKLGSLARFHGGVVDAAVKLEPGGEGLLTAFVEVPKGALKKLRDLYHEELLVTIVADGAEGTKQLLPLLATKPLPEMKRPFILHPPTWWEGERLRLAQLDEKAREATLGPAKVLLEKTTPFPTQPTLVDRRKINRGSEVEVTGWSPEDLKTFEANFAAIRTLGETYQRTLDERFARKATAMMVEFAENYARYPWHGNYETSDQGQAKVASNNLHESYWLTDLAGSYDLILNSASLSAEDKERIARGFLASAGRHQTAICSGFSNQTSTRFTSAAMCGFLLNDANLVQYAVYGHHGLALSAEVSVSPDGFLTEIPINYHWANLAEMLRLPLVCRNAGLKIDVATERIRKACDSAYLRAMPNQNAPPFGSCGYGTGANFGLGRYPLVYELFGDPKYQQLADPPQAQQMIDGLPSIVFPEGGMVVLREKERTGPDRTYLALLSTNRRRAADGTLHFVLYSKGALLCPSPGTLYNATGETDWVSPWNNTIYVDGQHQRACWGKVLYHDFSGEAQMALIDAGAIYEGVRFQRAVALADGFVFVIDRAASEVEHTYERVQMVSQEIARPPSGKTNLERNEGEHLRFGGTRIDGDWNMQWRTQQGVGLELAMAGTPGTEVFWGENRVNAFKPQMYAPTVLVRRKARETTFLTVMEPFRDRPARLGAARRVPVFAGKREVINREAAAVEAVTGNGSTVFVANFDGKPKTCEGHPVKAMLAVLRKQRRQSSSVAHILAGAHR